MHKIDLAYLPIVGRGLQIKIICAMHKIETNIMMSTPLGESLIEILNHLLELFHI